MTVGHEEGCRYLRELKVMTSFRPIPVIPNLEVALFQRLQAFEVEAKAAGAPREVLSAIAAARLDLRLADLRPWLGLTRGH